MVWIAIFLIIVAASLVLAYRSMKNYQELPETKLYGLFLIRDRSALTVELLNAIRTYAKQTETIFSFERLIKGSEEALVIYAPRDMPLQLNMLELEDYLSEASGEKAIDLNTTYAWVITSKKSVAPGGFFKNLNLRVDQKFFWQMVCMPSNEGFQATIRAMVVDQNPQDRIDLAKRVEAEIAGQGFVIQPKIQTTGAIFEAYKNRSIIPKEVNSFKISDREIINLLGS